MPVRVLDRRARSRRARRVRRTIVALLGLFTLGPFVAFAVGWLVFPTPTPADAVGGRLALVRYAGGEPLAVIRPPGAQNRDDVSLREVPLAVRQAVLAAEDRSFYANPGFSVTGIGRAVWQQLTGGSGGGSTITQQYVKITTGRDQHTLWRKYREIVAAAKISKQYSKDRILGDYLNTIYWGRGAYGIQTAAQAYFGRNVDQLDVAQGALLAGLIQAPSRWDPAKDPAGAKRRWEYVLDGMQAEGWLRPADRASLEFPDTRAARDAGVGVPGDERGHIYSQVRAELANVGIGEQALNQEGLRITTTIDKRLQDDAAEIARKAMGEQRSNLRAALVAIDTASGGIPAYYGGEDGVGLDYARVLKQPASSFKPFVLTAALQHDPPIGLGTIYDGSTPQVIAGQKVANSDGDSCDRCDLKTAMTRSINTVFYQLAVDVGPDAVARAAHQAGIPDDLLRDPKAGIALGDSEVRPVDMASAYATFAADGVYHRPHMIAKVETMDGDVLYDADDTNRGFERLDRQIARNVTESMLDVARASRIPLPDDRPVASKTGTVQHRISGQNNDAWTVGYTPSISTAVWVGTDDNSPIKTTAGRPIYGRMLPGTMWQRFMTEALRARPAERFGEFVPLGTASGFGATYDGTDPEESPEHGDGEVRGWSDDRGLLEDQPVCGLFVCAEDPRSHSDDRESHRSHSGDRLDPEDDTPSG